MSTTFEEHLAAKQRSPIYEGLPKYQHIERLGHEEVEGLLDGTVTVQEKLDGANATIAVVDGKFIITSRNRILSVDGTPATGFQGLVEHVLTHDGIRTLLKERPEWVLRGEWLVRHSLMYDKDAFGKFYVFDVQVQPDFRYLPTREYLLVLERFGIPHVPVLAEIERPAVDALAEFATGVSVFGPQREGVVVKRYDFLNKWGRTVWGKLVSADFREKHHFHMGQVKGDPAEVRFAGKFITDALVLKTIQTVADLKGESPRVQHMPAILGKTWHDAFTEELWDFVKDERVGPFDFQRARKTAESKIRDVALGYYNGIPSVQHRE